MITRNYKDLEPFHKVNGTEGRKIYDMPEGQIIHMTIGAGCNVASHITPVNVAFYVLGGEPIIEIGAEHQICSMGTLVESPKDIPHAIFNPTLETVKLLVIKLPRP